MHPDTIIDPKLLNEEESLLNTPGIPWEAQAVVGGPHEGKRLGQHIILDQSHALQEHLD